MEQTPISPSPPRNSATACATAGAGRGPGVHRVLAGHRLLSGGAQQGAVGLRSIEFTIASLVSLVIYLIPLIALLLASTPSSANASVVRWTCCWPCPSRGWSCCWANTWAWRWRCPVHRQAGFGLVAGLLAPVNGARCSTTVASCSSSVLLGLAFLSLAVLISVLARDRTRASAWRSPPGSSSCWCSTCCCWTAGGHRRALCRRQLCLLLLLLNPADVFRILKCVLARTCAPVRPGHRGAPVAGQSAEDGRRDGRLDSSAARFGQLEIQAMTYHCSPAAAAAPGLRRPGLHPSTAGCSFGLRRQAAHAAHRWRRSKSTAAPVANSTARC